MTIYTERIVSPNKHFWTLDATDTKAVTAARGKFTATEWDRLGSETQASIIASLSSSKGKVEASFDLIGEMTAFILETTAQKDATFEARKEAVRELLSSPEATTEMVEQIKELIRPVSYRTLSQWLEGAGVAESITDYITTKAAEASARLEAARAASKSEAQFAGAAAS